MQFFFKLIFTVSKKFPFDTEIYLSIFVKQLILFYFASDRQVVVTGWGATKSTSRSQNLLETSLPLVTNELCTEIIRDRIGTQIWHKQICAGGEANVDSCAGDSGGPLQAFGKYNGTSVRMIQYGVVSYGSRACGTEGIPGVYTRVTYYMDWILDTMTD